MVEAARKHGSAGEEGDQGQISPTPSDQIRLQRWATIVLSMDVMDGFSAVSAFWVAGIAAGGWLHGDLSIAVQGHAPIDRGGAYAEEQEPPWGYIGPHAAEEARRIASEIGADVWSAKDAVDLNDILDSSVDDPQNSGRTTLVVRAFFNGRFVELQSFNHFVASICGKTRMTSLVASSLKEGMRIASAIAELRDKAPLHEPTVALDEYKMPDPMWRSTIGIVRAFMCLAALVDLSISDRIPPDWLLKRVVKESVEGQRLFLGFMAMVYGDGGVPEDLLPKSQRLNSERIVQEHNDRESLFNRLLSDTKIV